MVPESSLSFGRGAAVHKSAKDALLCTAAPLYGSPSPYPDSPAAFSPLTIPNLNSGYTLDTPLICVTMDTYFRSAAGGIMKLDRENMRKMKELIVFTIIILIA